MSKQNTKKIDEWKKANTDQIIIRPRKEYHLPDRIAAAVKDGHADSRQDFIITATLNALNRLGYANNKDVAGGDSDFTKLTEAEAESLRIAEEEAANGDTLPHDAIYWDN